MCADLHLPLLGKVPLDPRIARSCDEGKSFLHEVPDSPAAEVYLSIVHSECDGDTASLFGESLTFPRKEVRFQRSGFLFLMTIDFLKCVKKKKK